MSAHKQACIGCSVGTRNFRWSFTMMPWYRQFLSLIYGLGVMLIALWAIEQGSGPYLIAAVVAMSLFTLMSIFGVQMESISVQVANGWLSIDIPFEDTSAKDKDRKRE